MKIGHRVAVAKGTAKKFFGRAADNTRLQIRLDKADVDIKRAQDMSKAALDRLTKAMRGAGHQTVVDPPEASDTQEGKP